ncbi:MAG: alcohol dehydrogenase catalytic domain-containing protein [Bacteriovorax sp.]|nr:alcohol dehydrogenase catalytic domain-containing protein [Bacteriovorax sp.]
MKNYEYVFTRNKKFERQELNSKSVLALDEVIVEPAYVGICGSDLYHYTTFNGEQLRLGHEWIGVITGKGASVSNLNIGDWVTTSAAIGCGECDYCLNQKVNLCNQAVYLGSDQLGSLRGSLKFKSFNALKLKSHDKSEVLIEVLAVAVEAIRLMKENNNGLPEKALILGCGTVGLLIAHLLKEENINTTIVDIKKSRIERARNIGLNAKPLNQILIDEKEHHSFDILFDATSDRDGNAGGWNYLHLFGQKNFLAIMIGKYTKKVEVTPDLFSRLAARLIFMRGVPLDTLKMTIDKWSGKLNELSGKIISHTYSSEKLDDAFITALDTSLSGKVVIEME